MAHWVAEAVGLGENGHSRSWRRVLPFLGAVLVLTVASFVTNLLWLEDVSLAQGLRLLLCVDQEMSIPTWWATATLAGLGVLTWIVGVSGRESPRAERMAWAALSLGFFFLSIDEFTMLHERIGSQVNLDGAFHHARWIVLWLPLGLMAGMFVLWRLWRTSRRTVMGLVLGAAVFLMGAVGVELVNTVNRRHAEQTIKAELLAGDVEPEDVDRTGKRNLPYVAGTAIEEMLEMLGVVIWFAVLFRARDEITEASKRAARSEGVSAEPS